MVSIPYAQMSTRRQHRLFGEPRRPNDRFDVRSVRTMSMRGDSMTGMRERENKAGYTAISCGRVGRGGNARFPTFRLDGYGRMDRRTDQRTDGRT